LEASLRADVLASHVTYSIFPWVGPVARVLFDDKENRRRFDERRRSPR